MARQAKDQALHMVSSGMPPSRGVKYNTGPEEGDRRRGREGIGISRALSVLVSQGVQQSAATLDADQCPA